MVYKFVNHFVSCVVTTTYVVCELFHELVHRITHKAVHNPPFVLTHKFMNSLKILRNCLQRFVNLVEMFQSTVCASLACPEILSGHVRPGTCVNLMYIYK